MRTPISKRRYVGLILAIPLLILAACSGGSERDPNASPAEHGERLFRTEGCSACHSTGPSKIVGPGLAGIAETAATRKPELDADAYLVESITSPGAFVVNGFSNVMPSYTSLSTENIDDLVAYLKTLD